MHHVTLKGFLIVLFSLFFVCCSKGLSPEKKALGLVLKSHALGGDLSVDDEIDKMIREGGDNIKHLGWDISSIEGGIYLVSYRYDIYSFQEGTGRRGYFFEVDLKDGSVRNVTEEYLKKMSPLSKPYKSEKEIIEKFREESETVLSG
jgi:hypothetical protein